MSNAQSKPGKLTACSLLAKKLRNMVRLVLTTTEMVGVFMLLIVTVNLLKLLEMDQSLMQKELTTHLFEIQ